MSRMDDSEVLFELRSNSMRNQVRRVISSFVGECEQDAVQRSPCSPLENRRREFEVADRIIKMVLEGGE